MHMQVFRTYNASITLDRLLSEMEEAEEDAYAAKSVDAKKADYDRANKEVCGVVWLLAVWLQEVAALQC